MLYKVKIATAVAVVLAVTTVVAAQQTQREVPSSPAPKSVEPKGEQKADPKAEPKAAPKAGEPKAAPKAAQPKAEPKASPKAADPKAAEPKAIEPKAAPKATDPKAAPKAAEPRPGAPGTSTSVTPEQRVQVRQTILGESNAPRVASVNFSLNVGTVVPRTVTIVVLPPRVVEIYPAWRGYYYFLVGDRIVIVEPDTLRIVMIIDA